MNVADIELNDEERELFGQIRFDWDHLRDDPDDFARNRKAVVQLMAWLEARKAIPEARLNYFNDPEYRTGRGKGSRRELLQGRGTKTEMMQEFGFLKYLRYFVCGPTLPSRLMIEFRQAVKDCGQFSSEDLPDLSRLARSQVRSYALSPHEAADEYVKLALDCGMWVQHALHIGDHVKSMR